MNGSLDSLAGIASALALEACCSVRLKAVVDMMSNVCMYLLARIDMMVATAVLGIPERI